MDVAALKQQLVARIQALEQEGILDEHFRNCHSLKEDNGVFFVVDLVPIFLNDVRKVIGEMATTVNQAVVDFHVMYEYCIKLQGSAGCIGARRLRNACSGLCEVIDNSCKDGCLLALNTVQDEYHILQSQMDDVVQLERNIVSHETQQP